MAEYRNPIPTVDIIIKVPSKNGIVLIKRANPPYGWALPRAQTADSRGLKLGKEKGLTVIPCGGDSGAPLGDTHRGPGGMPGLFV